MTKLIFIEILPTCVLKIVIIHSIIVNHYIQLQKYGTINQRLLKHRLKDKSCPNVGKISNCNFQLKIGDIKIQHTVPI